MEVEGAGMRTAFFSALLLVIFCVEPPRGALAEAGPPEAVLSPSDRVLILAPHPDDEVLGCAGIIQKAVQLNVPLRIAFLTYGDNNQWSFLLYRKHPVVIPAAVRNMGEVRHAEAVSAAKALGVDEGQLVFLGYPDFRTQAIWYAHWGKERPAKSMLSNVRKVPYADAFRPGAPYKGEEIVRDIKDILQDFRPTKIFLSHPADHNPDHRSLYLFTRVALWELGDGAAPELYPYLIHFKKWPQPKGDLPDEAISGPLLFDKKIPWKSVGLAPEEVTKKKEAIKKHHSQYVSCPKYLLSFIRSNELFGDFPIISLKEKGPGSSISSHSPEYLSQLPEELIDEERLDFVGIEKEFLTLEERALIFNLKLSRPIGKKVTASLYVFGYREDRPFQEMPKLHIVLRKSGYKVFDQLKVLRPGAINVERKPMQIKIRIPLQLLSNPQMLLTSAHTYRGSVPLDWGEWRVLQVSGTEE